MPSKQLYLLTYDHGGFVLWNEKILPQLTQALNWLEKYPKFKFGLDYESFTYDEMERKAPEINAMIAGALKKYPGRFAIGSTTYGQPLSLFISEESNARQLIYSVRTNMRHFGVTPPTYVISEFALNNQTPQLARAAGFANAILRSHVMGYGYVKTFDKPFGSWIGKDGTSIPAVPTYDGEGEGFSNTTMDNWVLTRWPGDTEYFPDDYVKKFAAYEPLLASRYDDLTLRKEGLPAEAEKRDNWRFVLLEELAGLYGEPKDELRTDDDDFHGRMPWGYCGNEIFNGCREAELGAARAERLCAMSVMLGGEAEQELLEEAWSNVLVAQHHDITICGLLDLSRRFIPASLKASSAAEKAALRRIASRFAASDGVLAVNVNPFPVREYIDDGRGGMIAELPALTAKIVKHENTSCGFGWNPASGELKTPGYTILLNGAGIVSIKNSAGKTVADNGCGALLRGFVNGEDCVSHGEWSAELTPVAAKAVQSGKIGGIPFRFELVVYGDLPRIECRLTVEMHGEHVGKAGETKGLPSALTINGFIHENKLRFVLDTKLESYRIERDLPYALSEHKPEYCRPESYWYEGAKVLVDRPAEKGEPVYAEGVYSVALRGSDRGLAVFNRGCMGAVLEGSVLSVPLIYSDEYMCGTRILEGSFDNEFALFPCDAALSAADVFRAALAYEYSPVVSDVKAGGGELREFTAAKVKGKDVFLTALYPEDGAIMARLCNYSGADASAELVPAAGAVRAETDLLGKELKASDGHELSFRGWEIKTLKSELK